MISVSLLTGNLNKYSRFAFRPFLSQYVSVCVCIFCYHAFCSIIYEILAYITFKWFPEVMIIQFGTPSAVRNK